MPAPYVTNGKQVLHTVDGLLAPYADAVSVGAADNIALALGRYEAGPVRMPQPDDEYVTYQQIGSAPGDVQRVSRGTFHRIAQQGDEFACSCGARWDATDEGGHP